MKRVIAFLRDDRGATAVEYGLIASGLALAILATLNGVGTSIKTTLTTVSTALK